ncbi:MAG: hypothetical protein ABWK05_04340 [Pyrobaculum sp.]
MKELLRRRIKESLDSEDYKKLAELCLELLKADNWADCWDKMGEIIAASGEYVLAKFLASAYVLAQDDLYKRMSPAMREFLARDVVVCIEKTWQVIESLSRQGGFADIRGQSSV